MKKIWFGLLLVAPSCLIAQSSFHYSSKKSAFYHNAAIASAHPLASEAAMMMLKKGGNAFDAAVTAQLVLAVVYPGAGNIGGGGLLTARTKKGKLIALDFRETAPGRATETLYEDSAGNLDTNASLYGRKASGVPGTIAGLFATLPYCRLPFKKLIQPAIEFAAGGFAITAREAAQLNNNRDNFIQYNDHPVAFVKKDAWKAGDTLIQKELAATLVRLQKEGRKDFYTGVTAHLIAKEMSKAGGLITIADLSTYRTRLRTPVEADYRGYRVVSFPPPSSGGILLIQMLKMVSAFPLFQYKFQSVRPVQLMIEAERRAYADRAEFMADPDFYHVPVITLMSDHYLAGRMRDYDSTKAGTSKETHHGDIRESMETTHISVVDAEGNMVSVTTTLNGSYGCKTVVQGAGFLMNNEMDDFSVKPGVPNMYGAVGGKANAIEPGKRMLSSMTPTLVLRNSKPFLIVGTPGGTTIPTSVFQTITDLIDFHVNLNDAVNRPKFHHQWSPDEVYVEPGFDQNTVNGLKAMGYKLVEIPEIGRVEAIEVGGNMLRAVADKRGDDSVSGF